jgi:hypothetical protein
LRSVLLARADLKTLRSRFPWLENEQTSEKLDLVHCDLAGRRTCRGRLHELIDLSLSGSTAHRPELDAPGATPTQALADDGYAFGSQEPPGKEHIFGADIVQPLHDLGAPEQLCLEPLPRSPQLQKVIDQDFHSISPIPHGFLAVAIRQKEVIHSAYAAKRIIKAGRDTGSKDCQKRYIRVRRYPVLSLDNM